MRNRLQVSDLDSYSDRLTHTRTQTATTLPLRVLARDRRTDGRTVVFEIERVASGARCRLGSLAIGFSELRLDARVRIGDFGAPL